MNIVSGILWLVNVVLLMVCLLFSLEKNVVLIALFSMFFISLSTLFWDDIGISLHKFWLCMLFFIASIISLCFLGYSIYNSL